MTLLGFWWKSEEARCKHSSNSSCTRDSRYEHGQDAPCLEGAGKVEGEPRRPRAVDVHLARFRGIHQRSALEIIRKGRSRAASKSLDKGATRTRTDCVDITGAAPLARWFKLAKYGSAIGLV